MEDNTQETCYQCGKTDCAGIELEHCPTTNIYHDACNRALNEMYGAVGEDGERRLPPEAERLDRLIESGRQYKVELFNEGSTTSAAVMDGLVKALATTRTALATAENKNQQLLEQLTPGSPTERAPTEWAYQQVCAALESHKQQLATAEAEAAGLRSGGMVCLADVKQIIADYKQHNLAEYKAFMSGDEEPAEELVSMFAGNNMAVSVVEMQIEALAAKPTCADCTTPCSQKGGVSNG